MMTDSEFKEWYQSFKDSNKDHLIDYSADGWWSPVTIALEAYREAEDKIRRYQIPEEAFPPEVRKKMMRLEVCDNCGGAGDCEGQVCNVCHGEMCCYRPSMR